MTRCGVLQIALLGATVAFLAGCQSASPQPAPSRFHTDFGMCVLADAGQPLQDEECLYYLAAGDALGHAIFTQYVAMLYTDPEYLAAIGELDIAAAQ